MINFKINNDEDQADLTKEARYALGELTKVSDTELLSSIDQFIEYWSKSNRYKQDSNNELNSSPQPNVLSCSD